MNFNPRRKRRNRDASPEITPRFEFLEPRVLLHAGHGIEDASILDHAEVTALIVAGDPNGSPADSPSNRVDPNTTTSEFAGVGSLFMAVNPVRGFICSGAVTGDGSHVLTAGHCVDSNNNGTPDFAPEDVSFILNYGSNQSHVITASAIDVHPDFTGFNNPAVNDDVAVITLSQPVPAGVPTYDLYTGAPAAGDIVTAVGYGQSGDGVNGYYVDASFTVKRVGGNAADGFEADDEGSGSPEVFLADFDAPNGSNGFLGGPSLGNDVETTLGGGDSGGPSLINVNGQWLLYGVNTFSFSLFGGPSAPLFGSGWGGMVVSEYAEFINSVIDGGGDPVNNAPSADAGADQNVQTGSTVQLDGSNSSDPDGDALTYNWSWVSFPGASTPALSDPTAVNPSFLASEDGVYELQLQVSDGELTNTDNVVITADSTPQVDSVSILKADYHAKKDQLTVEADSTVATSETLTVEYYNNPGDTSPAGSFQINYDNKKGLWVGEQSGLGVAPDHIVVFVTSDPTISDTATVNVNGGGGGGGGNGNGKGKNSHAHEIAAPQLDAQNTGSQHPLDPEMIAALIDLDADQTDAADPDENDDHFIDLLELVSGA